MKFTRTELKFLRNTLIAKSAYKDTEIPGGRKYRVWEPWMQSTLDRVEDALHTTRYRDEHEILP